MDRKEFLKISGLAGAASLMTAAGLRADTIAGAEECVLIPSETAGPYPLDLSTDVSKVRRDIREDQQGVLTRVKLKIVSATDCLPIANARVDIWHCNALGYYSGYRTSGQNGMMNYATAKWLRGIQMTDAFGEVTFHTIFPGWYPGRTVHIHFQVFLSSVLAVTSQLLWSREATNALLTSHQPYALYGPDPTPPETDGVFSNGYAVQVASLEANTAEGGYDSFLQVAINAQSTGLINLEPETGGQFKLGQNYPNPYVDETTVPFTLARTSGVTLDIFDISGHKVTSVRQSGMPPGPQTLAISLRSLNLADASYIYQLSVSNSEGEFRQCKVMTRIRD